jgi:pimeloyl-ACP methyl ester carboxylesterase
MMVRERDIRLADGRVVRVLDAGAAGDPAVAFFHSAPGSRLVPESWLGALMTAGIRLLAWDRPGYGGSAPLPGRGVGDVAADAAIVADEAGVERFAVWGAGGGGPHALACAARLPERVLAAAVAEPAAPMDAPGLDWFAGMAAGNVEEFTLALQGRERLHAALIQGGRQLKAADPARAGEIFGAGLAAADRAVLGSPQVAAFLLASMREGLAAGVEGWVEDDLALVAPGGVELADVRAPVVLWHGEQGGLVPTAHARWLADAIPRAELRLFPDDGALSLIFGHAGEIIGWLSTQLHSGRG